MYGTGHEMPGGAPGYDYGPMAPPQYAPPAQGYPQQPAGAYGYPPPPYQSMPPVHGGWPSTDLRGVAHEAARPTAQAARPPRRALAPPVAGYRLGRALARVGMAGGWLLTVASVISPAPLALGLVAFKGGLADAAFVGGMLAGAGLVLLLGSHAAIALFDQADATRDIANIERAKWADGARRDAAAG